MLEENTVLENSFSILWENLNEYQDLLRSKTAIIAYSGGKDSSLLLQFYIWLKKKNRLSKDPVLFHLDHSIRDNSTQEASIVNYFEKLGFQFVVKKKIFLSSLSKPVSVLKNPGELSDTKTYIA